MENKNYGQLSDTVLNDNNITKISKAIYKFVWIQNYKNDFINSSKDILTSSGFFPCSSSDLRHLRKQ